MAALWTCLVLLCDVPRVAYYLLSLQYMYTYILPVYNLRTAPIKIGVLRFHPLSCYLQRSIHFVYARLIMTPDSVRPLFSYSIIIANVTPSLVSSRFIRLPSQFHPLVCFV